MKVKKIALFLVAIIIIVINVSLWIYRVSLESKISAVCGAYNDQNFEYALELTRCLPEYYEQYYADFINYAQEIDGWEVSSQELYVWFEDVLLTVKENGYNDYKFSEKLNEQGYAFWSQVDSLEFLNDENIVELDKSMKWYPKFYELIKKTCTNYFQILIESRNLFKQPSQNGVIKIPVSKIKNLDTKIQELFFEAKCDLESLQKEYEIGELFVDQILSVEEIWSEWRNDYQQYFSLSEMYDLEKKTAIYVLAGSADNNYDVVNELIKIKLGTLSLHDQLDSAKDSISYGVEVDMSCLFVPTRMIIVDMCKIFAFAMPEVIGEDYKTLSTIAEEVADGYGVYDE